MNIKHIIKNFDFCNILATMKVMSSPKKGLTFVLKIIFWLS